jgi:hypothetical protein
MTREEAARYYLMHEANCASSLLTSSYAGLDINESSYAEAIQNAFIAGAEWALQQMQVQSIGDEPV